MKKQQVQIGQVYSAKVTDRVVPVRIEQENPHGGWDAVNLHTNRPVRIKSAQRLRSRVTVPGADAGAADKPGRQPVRKKLTKKELAARRADLKAQHTRKQADQENARLRGEREASADGTTATSGGERAMAESEQDKPKAASKLRPRKKREGMSCLDAAARVLAEAGEPMNTRAMVEAMTAKGYWTTDAPTPAATLYSAILRELQKKGDAARFTKVERGKFDLARERKEG